MDTKLYYIAYIVRPDYDMNALNETLAKHDMVAIAKAVDASSPGMLFRIRSTVVNAKFTPAQLVHMFESFPTPDIPVPVKLVLSLTPNTCNAATGLPLDNDEETTVIPLRFLKGFSALPLPQRLEQASTILSAAQALADLQALLAK